MTSRSFIVTARTCGALSSRRDYHRSYYAQNRIRRRAQRLASKYGAPELWRAFLPAARQVVA